MFCFGVGITDVRDLIRYTNMICMEHDMHLVDILDETGKIVGTKRRIDINKPKDIYHTIHVLLITPRGELVLSTIPVREDLPNLYAQQIGTTMASIRRTGETADQAAVRGVARELFIDNMPLVLVGEGMQTLAGGRKNYMSVYYGIAEPPESYSLIDIDSLAILSPRQLDLFVEHEPNELAASLITIWKSYRGKLPI